ncbi:receptor-like serine/threonine-protein kinase SD1-8 isoform X2 [Canna indica]|uniref:non-specific serine/threonine protein kinase n=1 Tax=Canna indica TaxID=4628 RepID=A0AAQ3JMY7_9LILI|nr:receptor-like serine/threonine-protein kinase SD1-8 isoform X2 [Canna indica]
MHQDSNLRIIHRDLKLSNILLDKDMNPKISDFGIVRAFEGDEVHENATTGPVGIFGYMAPEYISSGLFSFKSDVFSFGVIVLEIQSGISFKSDVFSFGVIVLEIQSGKRNRVFNQAGVSLNLIGDNETIMCAENSDDRPTMTDVVMMLASEDQLLNPLKLPIIASASGEGDFPSNETSFTITGR